MYDPSSFEMEKMPEESDLRGTATRVTAPSVFGEGIPDTEVLDPVEHAERAKNVIDTVRRIRDEYMGITEEHYGGSHANIIKAIKNGDEASLEESGFTTKYAQVEHIIAAILRSKPPVDIETVGPYACAHLNEDGGFDIDRSKITSDEMIGYMLAREFRRIGDSVDAEMRLVVLADELNDYTGGANHEFTDEEKDRFLVAVHEMLLEVGAIRSDDEAGRDFLIIPESKQVEKVETLIELLKGLGNDIGTLVERDDGSVVFLPNRDYVKSIGFDSRVAKKSHLRSITIKGPGGIPKCQALDASAFLGDENKELVHMVMLDKSMNNQQDQVYVMLRALKIVNRPEDYHNFFADMKGEDSLPPELVVAATMQHILSKLEDLIGAKEEYSEFAA